jgi:hypothetical protein
LLSVIFRLIEARRNEIRSPLPLFEAKSPGCPPRSAGTRCFAFIIKAHPLPSPSAASDPHLPVMPVRAAPAAGRSATGFPEHLLWHRYLGHLEGYVAAVADDLGADLDQLLSQAGQRLRLRGLRHRQRPQEMPRL